MSTIALPHIETEEQLEVLTIFVEMLHKVTADGGRKRAAGLKPSWKVDPSHEAAIFSHLNKWKHGETKDPDSGVNPLVHLALRSLAIAWQETNRQCEPPAARVTYCAYCPREIPLPHDCSSPVEPRAQAGGDRTR